MRSWQEERRKTMAETVALKHRLPNYVTPYLPVDWQERVKKWEAEHNQPVLLLAMDVLPGQCKNCGGGGVVYMGFCNAGPYRSPNTTKKVYTWYDGDMIYPRGWYVIETTVAIKCPECNGEVKQ